MICARCYVLAPVQHLSYELGDDPLTWARHLRMLAGDLEREALARLPIEDGVLAVWPHKCPATKGDGHVRL